MFRVGVNRSERRRVFKQASLRLIIVGIQYHRCTCLMVIRMFSHAVMIIQLRLCGNCIEKIMLWLCPWRVIMKSRRHKLISRLWCVIHVVGSCIKRTFIHAGLLHLVKRIISGRRGCCGFSLGFRFWEIYFRFLFQWLQLDLQTLLCWNWLMVWTLRRGGYIHLLLLC